MRVGRTVKCGAHHSTTPVHVGEQDNCRSASIGLGLISRPLSLRVVSPQAAAASMETLWARSGEPYARKRIFAVAMCLKAAYVQSIYATSAPDPFLRSLRGQPARSSAVEPEHILLGLLDEGKGLGSRILARTGVARASKRSARRSSSCSAAASSRNRRAHRRRRQTHTKTCTTSGTAFPVDSRAQSSDQLPLCQPGETTQATFREPYPFGSPRLA
jgi:hypothetical protein